MTGTECPGSIFGTHKYVAVYDEKPRETSVLKIRGLGPDEVRGLMTLNVYVQSVCQRCGDVIRRPT